MILAFLFRVYRLNPSQWQKLSTGKKITFQILEALKSITICSLKSVLCFRSWKILMGFLLATWTGNNNVKDSWLAVF